MDNYLSYRWPQGPGLQPPPVPSGDPLPPPRRPRRSLRRRLLSIVSILLCLSLLGGICFWAVNGIAGMVSQIEPPQPDDRQPQPSRQTALESDWTPADLPWGQPDPSVSLSVQSAGAVLTSRRIYQQTLPSLVEVEATHKAAQGLENSWQFQERSGGTGIILTRSGYVLTNYHIIDGAIRVQLRLLDGGAQYDAQVIGFEKEFDIAVLKFDPAGAQLTPARLGDSDELAVGDWVYAVGNPMGSLLGSMSMGIVSALDRDEDAFGSALGLIQIDAPLNPGNSGGALLNESGQVVGITCAKVTGVLQEDSEAIEDSVVVEGIGLAIPMSDAIPFVNRILATGESWRPAMGILCSAAAVDGQRGVKVNQVTGDPAREAGLKRGDLILAANGRPVSSLVELRRVLYRTGVEGEVTFTILRSGAQREITFALADSLEQR